PDSNADHLDPTFRFETVPYRADGGYSLSGLILALALSLAGGVGVGVFVGWIRHWFYLIVLFPVVIGFAVGGCCALGGRLGKLRNIPLAVLVGIVGGCLAMATMHYMGFRSFLVAADKIVPGALQMQFSLSAFARFIDQHAVAGVEIVSRPGQKGINLGYYGSYIYWIFEVVLVAGIAGAIVASVAARPFCGECGTWKIHRKLGRVNVPRALALEVITSGEIIRLAGQDIGAGPGRLSLEIAVC